MQIMRNGGVHRRESAGTKLKATRHAKIRNIVIPTSMAVETLSW